MNVHVKQTYTLLNLSEIKHREWLAKPSVVLKLSPEQYQCNISKRWQYSTIYSWVKSTTPNLSMVYYVYQMWRATMMLTKSFENNLNDLTRVRSQKALAKCNFDFNNIMKVYIFKDTSKYFMREKSAHNIRIWCL